MNPPAEIISESAAVAPALNPPLPLERLRILLVEDDYYLRELNAGALMRSGYNVTTATDGADAWRVLNANSYDLLITDNTMPRVTGMELIKKLRSMDVTMPIILASGTAPSEELEKHPWLQLNAFLPKPFTRSRFLSTVKAVLHKAYGIRADSLPPGMVDQPDAATLGL